MSALNGLSVSLCYLTVAATILSSLIPQKRTRKLIGFVIGLFILCSVFDCIKNISAFDFDTVDLSVDTLDVDDSQQDYQAKILELTAENLVSAADELLQSEGVKAQDIRLSLKISDKGRIYLNSIVIYISEDDRSREVDIRSIIYRNFSKEPDIVYESQKSGGVAEE